MRRIHFLSGCILTLFILVHLANHGVSIFGADKHIQVMTLFRIFYRNPVVESVLLAALAVQIISGLQLFTFHRKSASSGFDKLHRWSGLYLAVFMIIHLSAILVSRTFLHLDTNFYFGVAGLNSFPVNLFFIPYYGFAILAFFSHLASIHAKKMKSNVWGITPVRQAKTIVLVGFLIMLVLFYGLTNHFEGVSIPAEYKVLIGK